MDHTHQHDAGHRSFSISKWVLTGFLLVAAFFLWTEHRAHLLGILPYLLFAACPLMHLFHHGHGGHGSGAPESGTGRQDQGQAGEKP
ncbi:DUF2933 domain-containing protein [Noviherbaspirillum pedocola]|uniref:DUF2933 domain-containing protein n=1 Tax=Noviherbaspirillum pedocola TaxID=2801341 RepID=A0A934SSD4_9BURK|nr:DUF2933 domain-containing protein [Noviherbaspirillum pedocola]MBK4734644.1 DUF2933 domain-containing protein [Noviherbaspirillum pedocola]